MIATAAACLVGGFLILFLKSILILPVLHWVRSLSESELSIVVGQWGRILIVLGTVLLASSGLLTWRASRRARS